MTPYERIQVYPDSTALVQLGATKRGARASILNYLLEATGSVVARVSPRVESLFSPTEWLVLAEATREMAPTEWLDERLRRVHEQTRLGDTYWTDADQRIDGICARLGSMPEADYLAAVAACRWFVTHADEIPPADRWWTLQYRFDWERLT